MDLSPAVVTEGLVKRFGETVALDGVQLEVERGTVLGLLGPNGAGKTTVVRSLATLLRPDTGRAWVMGHDVVAEPEAVRSAIGLAGQFAAVDPLLTGRENLRMFARLFHLPRAEARRRADELLERFGVADAADRQAKTYSGGMRRRLDLASSLLTRPEVLFLDEPTTGLDPRSRNQIWQTVRELVREGMTLLLTTQYLEEADQLADRIAVIDHGRVIASGTGDELKDRVGGQMIEVVLAQADDRPRASLALSALGCGDPQPSELVRQLTLQAPHDGVAMVSEAARALREADIAVADLALRRPTLDDVFLELTGAPPSEDGDEAVHATSARDSSTGDGNRPAAGRDGRAPAGLAGDGSAAGSAKVPAAASAPGWLDRARLLVDPKRLRRAAEDGLIVTGRNMRHFVRQPQLLLFSTIQPIMFVLLFAFVFAGAIGESLPAGVDYVDFLLPGIFIQSVAFRASQTAVGLAEDLQRGVIDRLRSMPVARSAVLVGRTLADLVRNLFVIVLMAAVGYAIGFRFQEGPVDAVLAILVVAGFGLALSWIFTFVGLVVRGAETAQSAGFIVIFPLVFASSVFVPVQTMPDWLAWFANISPVTASADAARAFAIGGEVGDPLLAWFLWVGGLLAVFIPLCVWRYRRME